MEVFRILVRMLLLLGLWNGYLRGDEILPLSEAVRRAIDKSSDLEKAHIDWQTARGRVILADLNRRFHIDVEGFYRLSSQRLQITAGQFAGVSTPELSASTILLSVPHGVWDAKLALQQPVYSGGALTAALRLAELDQDIKGEISALRRVETGGRLKQSYYTCLMLQRTGQALDLLLDSLNAHVQRLESFRNESLIKQSDLVEIRVKIAELEMKRFDLQALSMAEQIQFQRLCGLPFTAIDPNAREGEWSLDDALAYLNHSHPLRRAMSARLQGGGWQRKLVRSQYRPHVLAFVELHLSRPGPNWFRDQWSANSQVGFGVQMPLFNWGRRDEEIQVVDLEIRRIEVEHQAFLADSETKLRQLFTRLDALKHRVRLYDGLLVQTALEESSKKALYQEGLIDHTTYLTALLGHQQHQAQREETIIECEMIKVSILVLAGIDPEKP